MKILILQLKRIGDLILTTPAMRALREAYPSAKITLLADASCRSLLETMPVDEWLVNEKTKGLLPSVVDKDRKDQSLSQLGFDWCLDFTGSDRSTWFTFASNAPNRATFARFGKKMLKRMAYSQFVDSSVRHRHTADHYTDLLKALEIEREGVPLDLRVPDGANDAVVRLLAEEKVPRPFAVIHAGTARPEKYWLPERWAEVAEYLHNKHHLGIVLTGSKDAAEQEHLAKIRAVIKVPVSDLSARTNLTALAALIAKATIFCGVDTAAMHLADAVGTPTLALFGITNPFHWRPRQTRSIVLRADTVEPFVPGQKGGPMADIPTDVVIAGMKTLLD
ncbi:lipopolysaccharide heptosyltransferase II [soil metagenome]